MNRCIWPGLTTLLLALAACGPEDPADEATGSANQASTVPEAIFCVFANAKGEQSCASSGGQGCKGIGFCTAKVVGPKGTKLLWKSSCGGQAATVIDGINEKAVFDCAPQPPPPTPGPVTEVVYCLFSGSGAVTQECVSSGGHGCKGVGMCAAKVWGQQGEVLYWKSSCGGQAKTVVDGMGEKILFACGTLPPPPPPPQLSELVTCVFSSTKLVQECYASTGQGCKGLGSCQVKVAGTKGEIVYWKSSCGGHAKTVVDGIDEKALFDCAPVPQPPPPPPQLSELVTCVFSSTKLAQECYASTGQGCKGLGSCQVKITGFKGDLVLWKSSCGGYAKTIIDGIDEKALFDCAAPPPPPPLPPPPPPQLSELVTCVFASTKLAQECYASTGQSCKGLGSCQVKITGSKGDSVDWKSSCGGYATTTIDGIDEKALLDCAPQPPPPQPPAPQLTELVTCVFGGAKLVQECYASTGQSCKGLGSCQVKVSGSKGDLVSWKSSCGGFATTIIDGNDEKALLGCP